MNRLLDFKVGIRLSPSLANDHADRPAAVGSEVVSEMAESVLGTKKCALYVPRLAVGAERESATPCVTEGCASSNLAPAVGLEPTTWWLTATRSAS